MPTWMVVVIALAVLVGCVLYISWVVGLLLREALRRRELKRWNAGLLERLAATGTDESRLGDLRRLHGIVDSRLRRLGATAPSLRSSLDKAMYLRTTQPDVVRQAVGGRKLPSVSAITRLMDRLDADDPAPEPNDGSAGTIASPQPVPALPTADGSKSLRKAWRLISENALIATVVGGLTVALVLYLIHLAIGDGGGGPPGKSTAQLVEGASDGPPRREQAGAGGARTFTAPAGIDEGPRVRPGQAVRVTCKVYKPEPESVTPNGYWYRLTSSPWRGKYYAPANSFWNGDRPGHRPYIHNTDFAVPDC